MDFEPCLDDYEMDYTLINNYFHTAFGSTSILCVPVTVSKIKTTKKKNNFQYLK